ncbi:MAG: hypothetical protein PWQ82_543 [Thermosediminibacterales bacterium]|nr:hypothetical protein [Thermosediminibacterales bacterium]MDK2835957.1 hypothetical protein [Thermosediminibacterales bacterium]
MIITVASGKGGTGKTTVATNLALVVKDKISVEFLDCDVEEPNAHLFLNPELNVIEPVTLPVPSVNEELCDGCGYCKEVCEFSAITVMAGNVLVFEELCHGCGGCVKFCPKGALTDKPKQIGVVESGRCSEGFSFVHGKLNIGSPLAPPVIKAVKKKAKNDGVVIIDAPPGTSCPVIASLSRSDYCLLVTEPTPFGLNDLKLAVGMVREMGIPFGVIINRSGLGDDKVEKYCDSEGIPILLKIPFDRRYAECYARGGCVVEEFPELYKKFNDLWKEIERRVEK